MPHIVFDPDTIAWARLFTVAESGEPQHQLGFGTSSSSSRGAGMTAPYDLYQGRPFQRGAGIGSIFRSILHRFLIPLGKELGREGLATTHRVLSHVVGGQNKNNNNNASNNERMQQTPASLGDVVREEARSGVKNLLERATTKLAAGAGKKRTLQQGEGAIGTMKRKKGINRQPRQLIPISSPRRQQGYYRTHLPPPPTATNFLSERLNTPTSTSKNRKLGHKTSSSRSSHKKHG
jgi:hypothetical protein